MDKNLIKQSVAGGIAPTMETIMDMVNVLDRIMYIYTKNEKNRVTYAKLIHFQQMQLQEYAKIISRLGRMTTIDLQILLEVLNGCQNKMAILSDMAAGLVARIRHENLPVVDPDNARVVAQLAILVRERIEATAPKQKDK